MVRGGLYQFVAIVALLGGIAALTPTQFAVSDRDLYVKIGHQLIVPDCADVHCGRVLVAVVLESLPGPSLLKWKIYAVAANAGAAFALMRLCVILGMSTRAGRIAMWLAALGFGSMYSLY